MPFSSSTSVSSAPFDLIHSDVRGPAPLATKGRSRYYVLFIDDYSRYFWVFLMKHHYELISILKAFKAMIQTQFSTII